MRSTHGVKDRQQRDLQVRFSKRLGGLRRPGRDAGLTGRAAWRGALPRWRATNLGGLLFVPQPGELRFGLSPSSPAQPAQAVRRSQPMGLNRRALPVARRRGDHRSAPHHAPVILNATARGAPEAECQRPKRKATRFARRYRLKTDIGRPVGREILVVCTGPSQPSRTRVSPVAAVKATQPSGGMARC